jgi:hypothetical protein
MVDLVPHRDSSLVKRPNIPVQEPARSSKITAMCCAWAFRIPAIDETVKADLFPFNP